MKFRQVGLMGIFISSMEEAKDNELIKKNNIKVIFGIHDKNKIIQHDGITNINVSMGDPLKTLAPDNMIFEAVELFKTAVDISNIRSGNVLVHCCAGNNRSALIVALYLQKYCSMELQEAVEMTFVKNNKPWMQDKGLYFIPRTYKRK